MLIDDGSSTNILYYTAFQQIRLDRDELHPVNSPLVGFGGMKVQTVGTITLPIVVSTADSQRSKFPRYGLLIFLQCHHWTTNSK